MSNSELVIALDLGTTALKCAVFDAAGQAIAEASREYSLITPSPEVVEFPVESYWNQFVEATRELLSNPKVDSQRIAGLGLSVQGETFVLVDANLKPLRNAIIWLDNRATKEAQELSEKFSSKVFYEATGQPEILAAWPAPKLLWLKKNERQVYDKAAKILLLEDYFLARLTGEIVSEGSLLTSTGYWNFRTKDWWEPMLQEIGIDKNKLPKIIEPGSPIGKLIPAVAEELGLPKTLIVCAGALDQACGAIGGGSVEPGIFSENTGAAVALCATLDQARLDPSGRIPCHYHGIPDTYMFHTFTSGGIVLKWFRDQLATFEAAKAKESGIDPYSMLSEMAANVSAGSDGLIMLPHLQGAMAPENNQDARGAFVGISLSHGKGHFVRSLLESIAFVVRRNLDAMAESGANFSSIRALGGGAKSPVWKQIEADITGLPVVTTKQADAGTLGAALITATGLGWYADCREAARVAVKLDRTYEPNPKNRDVYEAAYASFVQVYEGLVPAFPELAKIRTK